MKSSERTRGDRAVAIIPARGNSKGLSGKNIRLLAGKPLIAYTIEAALKASGIDRVFVTTDSPEIAAVAQEFGAEVPFLRPKHLATDTATVGPAIDYTLKRIYGNAYDKELAIVTLYPTSPFRSVRMIEDMTARVLEGYTRAVTIHPVVASKWGIGEISGDGALHFPLAEDHMFTEAPMACSRPIGLISVEKRENPKGIYIRTVSNKISLIDIDYLVDFRFAEYILKHNLFDFDA
ncbi:cytidylyltransferase domain-containing protein [Desulfobacter vibrioformis]|uniref:acylneuraminate cytidylyltransferase family protein n=1 Tax=Desulfobacter vibrioformis TaxID=34031 RepID=UPI00068F0DF4|nr:acylneuraminate cytidylyltransferase family protein [Desulfobacter vibrioformis]